MFMMNYLGNWTITELYNLPVGLRTWFVQRTIKQKEEEKDAQDKAISKAGRR